MAHQAFTYANGKYCRVSTRSLREINEASQPDQIVTVSRKGKRLRLRVVNIELESGVWEKLVTNLPADFSIGDLKELYTKRWGIETSYRFLKQKAVVETFTGESKAAVLQDFHAAILILNIAAIAQREQQDILIQGDEHLDQKNEYIPSKSKLVQDIKRDFVKFILCDNPLGKVFLELRLYKRIKKFAYHPPYQKSFPRHFSCAHPHRSPHPKSNL